MLRNILFDIPKSLLYDIVDVKDVRFSLNKDREEDSRKYRIKPVSSDEYEGRRRGRREKETSGESEKRVTFLVFLRDR